LAAADLKHLDDHGLLPTPTTEGLEIPFYVASECWMLADSFSEKLPSLCRLTDAMGTVAERAAVLLSYLSKDEPYLLLPEPEESARRAAVLKLFSDAVSLLPVDQIDSVYSHALGDVSPSAIWGVTPGIVGAPLSGRFGPPLAKNQSNTARIACAVGTSVVVPAPLMLGPR
jgi:hypothetical protein